MTEAASRRRFAALGGLGRRAGWGLADQALTSLATMVLGVLVARHSSASQFGVYALVFGGYTIVLNLSRALATEPLTVRLSAADPAEQRAGAAAALGTAVWAGVAGVLAGLVAAAFVPAGSRFLTIAFACAMPLLLVQDATRWACFVAGRGDRAFRCDLLWLAVVLAGAAVVSVIDIDEPGWVVALWGAGAGVAALFGVRVSRVAPRPAATRGWLARNRDLWPKYAAELGAVSITQQVYMSGISAVAGLGSVAGIRGAQILLGPVNVLNQGIGFAAVPEAVRARKRSRRALWLVGIAVSAVISVGAAAWGAIFWLLPDEVGRAFVGADVWRTTAPVLLPMIGLQVAGAANAGAYTILRALGAANRGLAVRLVSSVVLVAGGIGGAVAGGGLGAAWGLCLAAGVNAVLWWWQALRADPNPTVDAADDLKPGPGDSDHPDRSRA